MIRVRTALRALAVSAAVAGGAAGVALAVPAAANAATATDPSGGPVVTSGPLTGSSYAVYGWKMIPAQVPTYTHCAGYTGVPSNYLWGFEVRIQYAPGTGQGASINDMATAFYPCNRTLGVAIIKAENPSISGENPAANLYLLGRGNWRVKLWNPAITSLTFVSAE